METNHHSDSASSRAGALSSATGAPIDAGACRAQAPMGKADPATQADSRDRAINAGSPPATLVEEIEMALQAGKTGTSDATSSPGAINGGVAPEM